MPSAGPEIRDPKIFNGPKALDLLPKLGHRARIQNLKFEPAHLFKHGAAAKFHKN